jgi:hypothetical protein
MSIATTSKSTTQLARERAVSEAIHSSEMEGLDPTPEFRADAELYAEGAIDSRELGRRTRARYGIA